MSKVLAGFQKDETKFINKFISESDKVSLKISRFTAAVLPPAEHKPN